MLGFPDVLVSQQSRQFPIAVKANVANASGATNATVTTPLTFTDAFGSGLLPPNGYAVLITPNQAGVFVSVTGKTTSGFNVVLTPLSGQAVVAGTFDILVFG